MNTSLINKKHLNDDDVIRIASESLKQEVLGVSKIGGGATNKVYRVDCASGSYAMKLYNQHPMDDRDRLGMEFTSTSSLWDQGLGVVPQPIAFSREYQCAFYEFIEGTKILGEGVSQKDIEEVINFLVILKDLSAQTESLNFPCASEAAFSMKDIVDNIQSRLNRFDCKSGGEDYDRLRTYLNDEFIPLFKMVGAWSKKNLEEGGIAYGAELPQGLRTLSSSDFGFHNTLRNSDGKIIFLDFEYFGWDDPAKLVSDFLWHPAMQISEELKVYFVRRMCEIFQKDPSFQARLRGVFPLFGLKWCLILLNEFVYPESERRNFSGGSIKGDAMRLKQLEKAKQLCAKIKSMYKDFPYGG